VPVPGVNDVSSFSTSAEEALVDRPLSAPGWLIQFREEMNLGAAWADWLEPSGSAKSLIKPLAEGTLLVESVG
jgi:hypothetical protein